MAELFDDEEELYLLEDILAACATAMLIGRGRLKKDDLPEEVSMVWFSSESGLSATEVEQAIAEIERMQPEQRGDWFEIAYADRH